jgi:hypothetical protein
MPLKSMKLSAFLILMLYCTGASGQDEDAGLYRTFDGYAKITSDAPLEFISAESHVLKGILNPAGQTFAFQLDVNSLKGFNSELQQEHFYENYMETEIYPTAEFSGKIVEKIDFGSTGNYTIRAKGILDIHGVAQERIINCRLTINNGEVKAGAEFMVSLADHNITIPKLVYQKIAEEIKVTINVTLLKSKGKE